MSQSTTQRIESLANTDVWQTVCEQQDLVCNSGVVVWLDGAQVALFYLPAFTARPSTPSTTMTRNPGRMSSVAAWSAASRATWWLPRRSTSSTSAWRTAVAWNIRNSACGSGRCA